MPPALVMARVTVLEASRRRLLLALLLMTALVIAATAWGFDRLWTVHTRDGRPITATEVRALSSGLLILVTFMFAGVLALSAVLVASPSISSDVESGLALAMLSRPLRRADFVIGKWLGLGLLVVLYAAASGVAELIVVNLTTGYSPPQPVTLIAYVAAEGLILLSLSLLLSTQLSGITGGVIALVGYFIAWLGGIVGGIGTALQNASLADVGAATKILLPTDGLWRAAVYAMEPASLRAAARAAGPAGAANPFGVADPPPVIFVAWSVFWVLAVIALTVWLFRRKEI